MPEANENEHEGVRSQTLRTESIRPSTSCHGTVQGFIRAVRLIPHKIEKAKGRWEADLRIREFAMKALILIGRKHEVSKVAIPNKEPRADETHPVIVA